jgi:hypothetical protein
LKKGKSWESIDKEKTERRNIAGGYHEAKKLSFVSFFKISKEDK